jgi:hypothetical protein
MSILLIRPKTPLLPPVPECVELRRMSVGEHDRNEEHMASQMLLLPQPPMKSSLVSKTLSRNIGTCKAQKLCGNVRF